MDEADKAKLKKEMGIKSPLHASQDEFIPDAFTPMKEQGSDASHSSIDSEE